MSNSYYNSDTPNYFGTDKNKPMLKKGEVFTKPTKVATNAGFKEYNQTGLKVDKDFDSNSDWK